MRSDNLGCLCFGALVLIFVFAFFYYFISFVNIVLHARKCWSHWTARKSYALICPRCECVEVRQCGWLKQQTEIDFLLSLFRVLNEVSKCVNSFVCWNRNKMWIFLGKFDKIPHQLRWNGKTWHQCGIWMKITQLAVVYVLNDVIHRWNKKCERKTPNPWMNWNEEEKCVRKWNWPCVKIEYWQMVLCIFFSEVKKNQRCNFDF